MFNILKIFILLLGVNFIYYYFFTNKPTNIFVRLNDPKFTLLGPYNKSLNTVNDVYHQLIDLKNFSFKINPQPCQGYDAGILLVIIISSNPYNYNKRTVIRSTWGRSVDSTKLVFLFGKVNDEDMMKKITNESNTYSDIVQGDFIDAYRNMTYKHVMGLKWVTHHCPTAKYVLKTDDDVLVYSQALRQFLVKELSPWGATGLIACEVRYDSPVLRSADSKWMVTKEEFAEDVYPTYCLGSVILYSQDVVIRILSMAQTIPYFWIDDVHLTGVIAGKLGISCTPFSSLILSGERADILTSLGPQFSGPFLFGPLKLSPERISQIWDAIPK